MSSLVSETPVEMVTWFSGVIFAIIIVEAAVMLPLLRYIFTGWKAKRRDILDGLGQDACVAYFQMFSRNAEPPNKVEACQKFSKLYDEGYGRHKYWAPGILLLAVSTTAVTLVIFTVQQKIGGHASPFIKIADTAIAAIAGAYMWVVDDLISRCRRLDLSASDVQWGILRLIIAVPTGYAFAAVVSKDMGPFIAFSLGAFPFTTITTLLRRFAYKSLNIEPKNEEVTDDIVKLQGVDRAIVERLANEDIRTITQIAYCDPVHITMRSSLGFNFVTDCMNQALAQLYFQDGLAKLRPLGLRGAVEIRHFRDELSYEGNDMSCINKRLLAQTALPKIAQALQQDEATIVCAFDQIAEDPFTSFLYEIWT